VSRRYPELTDGTPDCDAKCGQEFRRPQADLLSHDWLVGFYRGDTVTQVYKPAFTDSRGNTFFDEAKPGCGRPGLLELVFQAELAHRLRQQVGQSLHAVGSADGITS
jgi:hypothetical protein